MKGTLVLVSPGKGNLKLFESGPPGQPQIPAAVYQLFIADGIPISRFITSLILRAEGKDNISVLPIGDPFPWRVVNNIWTTSKPEQTIVVIASNNELFRIAAEIAPRPCRRMLESYHPATGDIFISIRGDGGFTIIAS